MAEHRKPNLSDLHGWGCTAYVLVNNFGRPESIVREGRWIGFDDESKGYHIYWPKTSTVTIECNIRFNRNETLVPGLDDATQPEGEN